MTNPLLQAAERYLGLGLCPLPAILAEKRPIIDWRNYQQSPPTGQQLKEWFARPEATAICLVGGAVSGSLEVIDFDLRAEFYERWAELVREESPGLLERLVIERSQSGGKHVIYRCTEGVDKSLKLAQRELACKDGEPLLYAGKTITPRRKGDQFVATLTFIETKAEGGVFLCHPSPGYDLEQGSFEEIPVITARERDILLTAAKSLNEVIREVVDYTPSGPVGDRPGDDYARRADIRPILLKHGWRPVTRHGAEYWRRPGKDWGWSGEIKNGRFYCYTTNAPPFEEQCSYNFFRVYALLEHNGDFSAAASKVATEGYGGPLSLPPREGSCGIPTYADRVESMNGPQADSGADGGAELPAPATSSGRWILDPRQTVPTANAFVAEFHAHPDGQSLHCFADTLLEWNNGSYREVEEGALVNRMQNWLHGCLKYDKDGELEPFHSNPMTVKAAITTLRGQVHLPAATPIPSWLGDPQRSPEPRDIVACKTKLLHLPTNRLLPATPRFFTTCALEFDPEPTAPFPQRWGDFLHELFDGDTEQWDLLQEWFGYCLTGDTSLQKMLLIVGPKRSGKGTLARVLSRLVGQVNVCGPTVSSLAGPFGLQSLVGKSLAVVSDARFHGENIMTVVERLLCISGEDLVTIERKHLTSLHMKLLTRFMFMTNELPRFTDSSAALAARFLILQLRQSFYGREDPQLTEQLCTELPGILNWAIEGWRRLRDRGHFQMPQASMEAVQELEELSSPVTTFVRARCVLGPDRRVPVADLFNDWRLWCDEEGRTFVGTKSTFGRDLVAAYPRVSRRRNSDQSSFYDGISLKGLST